MRDPDRDAHGDAQVASGAGQVLHPTYEAGHSMRDPDDYFTPWGVSACATPTAMHTATPKSRPVQDKSCTPRTKPGTICPGRRGAPRRRREERAYRGYVSDEQRRAGMDRRRKASLFPGGHLVVA